MAAIVLLLGLGLAWLLAGSLARPLRRLAATARRVAGGDLDARARVEGSSEQREVASAFNDMTARLARALRAQREFVANASHQLRTPLTGLRLRLEAASLKANDPEVERELVAAERETERLARLLSELLTLARERERPEPEDVSLAEVARAAHERWEAPAESGGRQPGARARRGRARRRGDRGRPRGGARQPRRERPQLLAGRDAPSRSSGAPTATGARLAVLDEGPGIDPAEREQVFERFFRGEASRGGAPGTGLGLPVVEALAARWGGSVELVDRPEGGTRAEVVLPLATGSAQPSPDPDFDDALPGRGLASNSMRLRTAAIGTRARDLRPRGRRGHRVRGQLDLRRQRRPVGRAAERRRGAGAGRLPRGPR